MKIKELILREIFDSRGEPTLEAELSSESGAFRADIPSGKSRGTNEASVLPYADARKAFEKIAKLQVVGRDFSSVSDLDAFLIKLDGTPNKEKLGGNTILAVSLAFLRACAAEEKIEPWEFLRKKFFSGPVSKEPPLIFSNLINGGAHANNNLAIQEFMVVVRPRNSFGDAIKKLTDFHRGLEVILSEERGIKNIPIGDEGGYSLDFENNFSPIRILERLIHDRRLENEFSIGLDAAASSFYGGGAYVFDGKRISTEELLHAYKGYFEASKLLTSIEDPFHESDFKGFKAIRKLAGDKLVIGDDLTVTDPSRIEGFAKDGLINGVIIKPNQIGTISETCNAVNAAAKRGVKCIVSHRSGETEDNFIIHLAKAAGAYGVKIGAPFRERIFKFNELIRIYDA